MNLTTKHPLKFSRADVQALQSWLVHVIAKHQESAYYKLVQLLAGRIVHKIQKKGFTAGPVQLDLKAEEALALQIIVATNDWPGDDLDNVLHHIQITLPPPTYRDFGFPPEIPWNAPLELGEGANLQP